MFNFKSAILRFAQMYGLQHPKTPQLYMGSRLETRKRMEQFRKILLDELTEADEIIHSLDEGVPTIDVQTEIADWLGDVQVYCAGEMMKYGLDNDEVLRIIMESNFSKLGADGQTIMKDGKVQKGPNYWKPEPMLKAYIQKAMATINTARNDRIIGAGYDHGTQVGGSHYSAGGKPQHWDLVLMYKWDYFQGQIIKYLMRWKTKHEQPEKRLEDLQKARSFLDKYIAAEEQKLQADKYKADASNAIRPANTGSINMPNPGYDMFRAARDLVAGAVVREERQQGIPGYDQLEVARKPQAIESNEHWSNEGYYGDMTQLYKCRHCRSTVRTSWAPPPHGCMAGAQQKQALDANLQGVEGAALGAVAVAGRTVFQTGSGNS